MSLPTLEQVGEVRRVAREMREESDKRRALKPTLGELMEIAERRADELTATETTAAASGGIKHDAEKLRVDLLPVDVLKGVAGILTHGAEKYGDRNWEEGIAYSRLYRAALGHLLDFWDGKNVDDDSGLLVLDHALCELMFLRAMSTRKPELDDRPKEG